MPDQGSNNDLSYLPNHQITANSFYSHVSCDGSCFVWDSSRRLHHPNELLTHTVYGPSRVGSLHGDHLIGLDANTECLCAFSQPFARALGVHAGVAYCLLKKPVTRQLQVFWYAHISECGGLHDRKMLVWARSCTMLDIWEGRWQRQTKK